MKRKSVQNKEIKKESEEYEYVENLFDYLGSSKYMFSDKQDQVCFDRDQGITQVSPPAIKRLKLDFKGCSLDIESKDIPKCGRSVFISTFLGLIKNYGPHEHYQFRGMKQMNKYVVYLFNGKCPIHNRMHDGQAWIWQLLVQKDGKHSGFKCFRDNTFKKMDDIPELH